MSNQSSSQKSEGQRTHHLQSESIPFSLQQNYQSPNFSQFTAATSAGYNPKPQAKVPTFSSGLGFNTMPTSQQAKPTKPMTEFGASAYAAAEGGSTGLQPPPAQPIDLSTFKGLQYSMVDNLQLETREIYDEVAGTFQWEMFKDQDDRCIKYIRDECVNKRVFLISSGGLGRKVVPAVHDLSQVYAIYIYCADVVSNREWSNKYTKVRVVCNDDDRELLPQLAVDVAQANMEWGDALVKQGQRDKAKPKYQKALDNLNKYTKKSDPTMIKKVQSKLDECK